MVLVVPGMSLPTSHLGNSFAIPCYECRRHPGDHQESSFSDQSRALHPGDYAQGTPIRGPNWRHQESSRAGPDASVGIGDVYALIP